IRSKYMVKFLRHIFIKVTLWVILFISFGVISVMKGNSVTLNTDVTEVQKYLLIQWMFESTRIAEFNRLTQTISTYDSADGRFRDRLKLDQTGSLTITNTRTTDSGLYQLTIGGEETKYKSFNVTYHLSLPETPRNSSTSESSSSSNRVTSMLNVSHVTLSWYKGNSLLSSISVSDLSISLSLPLEVEYQDKNTYSCVLNNPISNQTQHLDTSRLSHTCTSIYIVPDFGLFCILSFLLPTHQMSSTLVCCVSGVLCHTDAVKSVSVMKGSSVTLNTDDKVQKDDQILWLYKADNPYTIIAEINRQNIYIDATNTTFEKRLQIDSRTGSLTIRNIRPEHSGLYKLQIIRNRIFSHKSFTVALLSSFCC
uniref:Ig-like domain-containing protein n=1 Tax=Sinocyclocheilus grahami TaxID=75366 RepID=A0A672N7D6_SINGR